MIKTKISGLNVKKVDGNWVLGEFWERLEFSAKVYAEPSEFGINGGKVSKLWVRTKIMKTVVIDYDRGWIHNGDAKENLVLPKLLEALEKFSRSEQFAEAIGERP